MRRVAWLVTVGLALVGCGSDDATPDPGASGSFVASEGTISACTGKIAYKRWTWTGAPATATLVFANGRTDYTARYEHVVDLIDRPWHVVMFDHYGQGKSDGPRAHADDFDTQHVCDMKQVIEQLAEPGLPVVVMAHSMGAFVSTRFAQLHPGVVSAYAFSAPMYGLPSTMSADTVKAVAQGMIDNGKGQEPYEANTGEKETCEENKTTHDCDYYDRWLDDPTVWIGNPTWGWVFAAYTGFDRVRADVALFAEPVLVLQAGEEAWVDKTAQSDFCAAASSCEMVVKEGSYHEIFNELDRAKTVRNVEEFLDDRIR